MRYTRYPEIAAVARIMKKKKRQCSDKEFGVPLGGIAIFGNEAHALGFAAVERGTTLPVETLGRGCDARLAHVSTDSRASRYLDESNVPETHQASHAV